MASDTPSFCKVILAGSVAKSLLEEVKVGLAALDGRKPNLLGVLANSDSAAKVYADWTQKTCEEK